MNAISILIAALSFTIWVLIFWVIGLRAKVDDLKRELWSREKVYDRELKKQQRM